MASASTESEVSDLLDPTGVRPRVRRDFARLGQSPLPPINFDFAPPSKSDELTGRTSDAVLFDVGPFVRTTFDLATNTVPLVALFDSYHRASHSLGGSKYDRSALIGSAEALRALTSAQEALYPAVSSLNSSSSYLGPDFYAWLARISDSLAKAGWIDRSRSQLENVVGEKLATKINAYVAGTIPGQEGALPAELGERALRLSAVLVDVYDRVPTVSSGDSCGVTVQIRLDPDRKLFVHIEDEDIDAFIYSNSTQGVHLEAANEEQLIRLIRAGI